MSSHFKSDSTEDRVQVFDTQPFDGAVLDLRTLPTQPNVLRSYRLQLVAPEDLGTAVLAVKPGEVMEVDVDATSMSDGILLQAQFHTISYGECVRCLGPLECPVELELCEMFFTAQAIERMRADQGEEAVADLEVLDGDTIRVDALIRDAIVSQLPYAPVCSEDCEGLCDGCGQPLRELPQGHCHRQVDPRLAALSQLLPQDPGQVESN